LRALTIQIHGTAKAELAAAKRVGKSGGVVEHRFVSIPELKEAGDVRGSKGLSWMTVPATYIPMKNAIYYSLAAAYAEEKGSDLIIGGHNADDARVFEDTSEEFFADLRKTLYDASPRFRTNGLVILRPLSRLSKSEVVRLAAELGVPFRLTWSCNRAGEVHCWKCAGCAQRREAFDKAGINDPLRPKKV
jgi:7-cyano-7-deazaguanine synthase